MYVNNSGRNTRLHLNGTAKKSKTQDSTGDVVILWDFRKRKLEAHPAPSELPVNFVTRFIPGNQECSPLREHCKDTCMG